MASSASSDIRAPSLARHRSAASAKSLSGWDVAAFQRKVDEEQFYEAHQVVKAAAQRHFQSGDVATACGLVNSAVRVMFAAANQDCQAEAADLLETAAGYVRDAHAALEPPLLPVEAANAEIRKLCELYALWLPRTGTLATRKIAALRELMSLSSQVSGTKGGGSGGSGATQGVAKAGARPGPVLPELHREAGHACFAMRDFRGAVDNFAAAGDAVAAALALEEWAETARVPAAEVDLLVTRAVLQFLLFRDTAGAEQLRTRCAASPRLGDDFRASPLCNFTKFLTAALAGMLGRSPAAAGAAAAQPSKPQWQQTVELLLEHYTPSLRRDAEFNDYYFAHLKRIYFGTPLPQQLQRPAGGGGLFGGMDMGKMMQMASSMMQQNPNMVRQMQQMMMGGGGPGRGGMTRRP